MQELSQPATVTLERLLGRPDQEGHPFSSARLAEYDRLDEFPSSPCKVLNDFGLQKYYVPACYGGSMADYDELTQLWRSVARRDLTVAIGHGKTFLGAICIWVAGDRQQADILGREVSNGTVVSWGLTERNHGSDLLAGELTASKTGKGWRLNGEKWLINNATRGQMICILARTSPKGGPRGFSLLLVDKRNLPTSTYRFLPKELTHGIRGADISGIAFNDAEIPDSALVGRAGEGIEIVLKSLQVTRTVCTALSLGAADHALRLVAGFAKQHYLYGHYLIELPLARKTLSGAMATLLMAEAVSIISSRSLHTLTREMSVVSAVAKAFVPTVVDEIIVQLGELLGARGYLTDVYADGMFQKLDRDHRIVAIFDGTTVVNRNALIDQFHTLARAYSKQTHNANAIAATATLTGPLDEIDYGSLSLLSGQGCSLVQSFPDACRRILEHVSQGSLPEIIGVLVKNIKNEISHTIDAMAAYKPASKDIPQEIFHLAARYELCYAATACMQLWLHNSAGMKSKHILWQDALWLEVCLHHILLRLNPSCPVPVIYAYDRLVDIFADWPEDTVFSLFARP